MVKSALTAVLLSLFWALMTVLTLISILVLTTEATETQEPRNLYFTADWCGYCVKQSEVIKELEAEGYKFETYNYPDTIKKYKITSYPTIVIIKNGKILKLKGFQSARKLRKLL